jgi:hypothetical protein
VILVVHQAGHALQAAIGRLQRRVFGHGCFDRRESYLAGKGPAESRKKEQFSSGSQEAASAAKGLSDFEQSKIRTRTRRDVIAIATSESVAAFSFHNGTRYIVSSMVCWALEYECWNYYNLLQVVSAGD